jgi:hypothetical protein
MILVLVDNVDNLHGSLLQRGLHCASDLDSVY